MKSAKKTKQTDQKQGQIARGRPSVGEKLQETKTNGDRRQGRIIYTREEEI